MGFCHFVCAGFYFIVGDTYGLLWFYLAKYGLYFLRLISQNSFFFGIGVKSSVRPLERIVTKKVFPTEEDQATYITGGRSEQTTILRAYETYSIHVSYTLHVVYHCVCSIT